MPKIRDEFWPAILPVLRPPQQKSFRLILANGTLLWIGEEEVVFANVSHKLRLPDEAFRSSGVKVLESIIRPRHLERFKITEINSIRVAPVLTVGGIPRCVFAITAGSRVRHKGADVALDSVPIEALGRLLGSRMVVGRPTIGIGFWALGLFVWSLIALLLIPVWESRIGEDWLFVAPPGVALLGIWVTIMIRGVRALKPRAARASRPIHIRRVPFRSAWLGLTLKVIGLGLVAAAYALDGSVVYPEWLSVGLTESPILLQTPFEVVVGGWALLIASMPGLMLLYLGYLIGQPDGTALLKEDGRPRILYLRSFGDDARYSFNDNGYAAAFLGIRPFDWLPPPFRYVFHLYPLRLLRLLFGRALDTTEEQLMWAVSRFGPLIAIGRPNQKLVTPGVPRIYVSHDDWQRVVVELMDSAPIVIIQTAPTEGIWWEVETVLKRVRKERVLICLCAVQNPDDLDTTRARLNLLLPAPIHGLRPGHVFVWIDRDGSPHAEFLRIYSPFSWPLRGTSANLDRTFAPFVASWKGEPTPPSAANVLDRQLRVSRVAAVAAVLLSFGVQFGVILAYSNITMALFAPSPESLIQAESNLINSFRTSGFDSPEKRRFMREILDDAQETDALTGVDARGGRSTGHQQGPAPGR